MQFLSSIADFIGLWHARHVEPLFYRGRRMRRLAQLGRSDSDAPPAATLDLGDKSTCCGPDCDRFRLSYGGYYSRLKQARDTVDGVHPEPMLLTAIDLRQYPDYPAYWKALRRHSGNFCRDALKAGRLGYHVAPIDRVDHLDEIRAVHRSLKVRSFGLVLDALLPVRFSRFSLAPTQSPKADPQCEQHWELAFGVFGPGTADPETSGQQDRLVGYAGIERVGNVLIYADFIGHGDHLRNGIMMLLHTEVVQWLLDRNNRLCRGVEFLANGTLERGSDGMFFWKKKALFRPCLVDQVEEPLPADFDPKEYLRLNPDVARSGESAVSHYRKHGRKERRLYRYDPPEDFDPESYLRLNPDVANNSWDAATHYALFGRRENRPYKD